MQCSIAPRQTQLSGREELLLNQAPTANASSDKAMPLDTGRFLIRNVRSGNIVVFDAEVRGSLWPLKARPFGVQHLLQGAKVCKESYVCP